MKRHSGLDPRKIVAVAVALVIVVCIATTSAVTPIKSAGPPATPEEARQHIYMMLFYISIALLFSFLCSVAEAVLLSVTPSFIQNLEQKQKSGAGVLKGVKRNVDRSLAAILTLNTIAHTVGAGGAGAEAAKAFGDEWVNVSMAVLTLLILFLSEIIPKTIGAVYWRRLAVLTARFVQLLTWSLYPLIWLSELLTNLLTRGKPVHTFNREEFAAMADIGAKGGHLDAKESRILKNLFRFPELCAADIMTPRTVVFALQQDLSVAEVLQEHPEISFTRIPIYGEDRDDTTGFVLRTDLLLNQQQGDAVRLHELRREIRVIEELTRLTQVLEELLDNRAHILLAVDEYGGMAGVVTLEDVVETLMGIEIVDEADQIDDMRKLARQKWQDRMKRAGIDVRAEEGGG